MNGCHIALELDLDFLPGAPVVIGGACFIGTLVPGIGDAVIVSVGFAGGRGASPESRSTRGLGVSTFFLVAVSSLFFEPQAPMVRPMVSPAPTTMARIPRAFMPSW
ncbi:hypothetical protein KKF84_07015 [Myxococcota bacterium]|nr:hypothetical protein [Myxococcota bacterium]